ncbi:MAG TPA: sigma-70 family RNA polymerase sigma factor [Candidatus Polarisedimenticolaceae bacterium]
MTELQGARSATWTGSRGAAPPTDAEIVERIRGGDADAFAVLVRRHGGRMLAVTRRFLRDEDAARDAVQEAFLSAYRSIGEFRGEAQLSTWLHRVAVHAALMRLRSARRRPEESLEALLPEFDETGHHARPVAEWRTEATAALSREEERERVRRAVDRLPTTYRTVLMLRDIEERDTEETARLLGTTTTAVKVRLHRARQALRTLLEPTMTA